MAKKHWQFIFNSSFGRTVLRHPPRNWNAIKFNMTRDQKLKGMTRKFSTTLEFCDDGYEIIRDLFFTQGIDASLQIEINQVVAKGWNEVVYREVFWADFSECEIDEMKASIKMTTSDFERKLLDRQSDQFNLNTLVSVDGNTILGEANNYKTLLLHDRTLLLNNKHKVLTSVLPNDWGAEGFPKRFSISSADSQYSPKWCTFDMDIVYKSNDDFNNVSYIQYNNRMDSGNFDPESFVITSSKKDILLSIMFDMVWTVTKTSSGGSLSVFAAEVDDNGKIINENIQKINLETTSQYIPTHVYVNENMTISIQEGSNMVIGFTAEDGGYFHINTGSAIVSGQTVPYPSDYESIIATSNVDYIESSPTECKVMLPFEAIERTLQIITGVQAPLYSPVFGRTDLGYPVDGDLSLIPVTNGLFVRQFPLSWEHNGTTKTNQINASFKELYEGYNGIMPLAAYVEKNGVNSRLVIDKYENIFNASKVGVILDNISDLSFSPNKGMYYSVIKCGYVNQEHEEINGMEAFCGETNYSLPVGNTTETYDIVSKLVADDIAWSLAQRKPYSDYPTEDTRYDEKLMIMDCKWQGDHLIPRRSDEYTTIQGVFAPELVYNLNISPARNLQNHKKIIASGLLRKQDKSMKFTKGSKNDNVATQKIGESSLLHENGDVAVSSLGFPIIVPNIINVKSIIDNATYDYIINHSSELIGFTYKKRIIYGYVDDLSYDRVTGMAEFKLLQSNR